MGNIEKYLVTNKSLLTKAVRQDKSHKRLNIPSLHSSFVKRLIFQSQNNKIGNRKYKVHYDSDIMNEMARSNAVEIGHRRL